MTAPQVLSISFVTAVLSLLWMLFEPAIREACWQIQLRRHNRRVAERQARRHLWDKSMPSPRQIEQMGQTGPVPFELTKAKKEIPFRHASVAVRAHKRRPPRRRR